MIRKFFLILLFYFHRLRLIGRVRFEGRAVILALGESKIEFGRNVVVSSDFYSNLIGLQQRSILVARDGGKIKIGDNVGISGATIYATNGIEIGNNVIVGANVKILDNDFHSLEAIERVKPKIDRTKINSRPIVIGNNCFLGANAIILKGSTIGDNCVVGAGSIVCGDFSRSDCIIAGNPGVVIRRNA